MRRRASRTGPPKEQRRPGGVGVESARGIESRTAEATASDAPSQARPDAETVTRWLLSRAARQGTFATLEFEAHMAEYGVREMVKGKRLELRDLARLHLAFSRVHECVQELRPAGTPDAWELGRP
jgi:hypothetical protein